MVGLMIGQPKPRGRVGVVGVGVVGVTGVMIGQPKPSGAVVTGVSPDVSGQPKSVQ